MTVLDEGLGQTALEGGLCYHGTVNTERGVQYNYIHVLEIFQSISTLLPTVSGYQVTKNTKLNTQISHTF